MFLNTKFAKTLAIAATAAFVPAVAHAEEKTFERDGVSYVYQVAQKNGQRVLTGTADGRPFRLVVAGQRVAGEFNHSPVEFSLRDVKRDVEVAMR